MENNPLVPQDPDYSQWLGELKTKFRQTQLKAAVTVNRDLLCFYWDLGLEIVERQKTATWGSGFLKQLSHDLILEFPHIKGFSLRNLKYIRQWIVFYTQELSHGDSACVAIGQQPVAQLKPEASRENITSIPWGHNLVIISKCQSLKEALFYVSQTIKHGWSRAVLTHQIESELWIREGTAISNFSETLPAAQSDLAQQTLKDPYIFDFLSLSAEHKERDLENQLIDQISKFLLELGAGFAYLGKQVPLQVGERDFFIDLLFYHAQLHCYVIVELKTGDFEPEHAGKLNFYIKAVDEQKRSEHDAPTIGILLCKNRDSLVAEYALSDINKPIGVSEYRLTQSLPENLQSSLPSVQILEAELNRNFNHEA